jgi:predicted MFS family arabinose efflux permease
MGSSALGGFLFSRIGLEPLILVSAAFSLLALILIPYLPDKSAESPVPAEGS